MRPSASVNCGSYSGRMARPRSCQRKQPIQSAASDIGSTMSIQLTDRRSWWNCGAISQNRSITRTTTMPIATLTRTCGSRLSERDSSSRNGTTKWNDDQQQADGPPAGVQAVQCTR